MAVTKRSLLFIILLTIYTNAADAALRLELNKLTNSNYEINVSGFPVFITHIKALRNDVQYKLNINHLTVIEDNRTVAPFYISDLADGWQELRWLTTTKGYNSVNITRIIATIEDESAFISGTYPVPNYSRVLIRDTEGQQIEDASYGIVPANGSAWIQIYVNPYIGKRNSSGFEMPLRIDSITNTSPYIKLTWQGNVFNRKPPPVILDIGSFNLVDLDFYPVTNDFVRDIFTVHYDGGMKEELTLTANHYPVQKKQLLKLTQPNGGELLAPCQNFNIIWKGNSRDIPTKIEFTSDAGKTWNYIGQSYDTLFNWVVPKSYSDNCRIRIKQEFKSISEKYINVGASPVEKLSYDSKGNKLLNAMSNGMLAEFDMISFQKSNEYYIHEFVQEMNVKISGLGYLIGDSSFFVAYENQSSINKPDSIAFFKVGISQPYMRIGIDTKFDVKRALLDASKSILALTPVFDNRIILFSALDGTYLKSVSFPYVVQSFAFNSSLDTAAVYLINGEFRLLSLPEFNTINVYDLNREPYLVEIGLSPDGKFAALGGKTPKSTTTTSNNTKNHVLDLKTGVIIRTTRNTSSDSKRLEFNPTSNVLLIGSEYQPQLALWDLITGDFIGTLGGSIDAINDFEFSPEGHSLAFASGSSPIVTIKTFSYPEMDESDNFFGIRQPEIKLKGEKIPNTYLADIQVYVLQDAVCNTGTVPINFNMVRFKDGKHFRLIDSITPLTLIPGECIDFQFVIHPLDTGKIIDTVIFTSDCFGDFIIPIETFGLKRNLTFLTELFEFEETCVGVAKIKKFDIIRNDDPVPVKINSIGFIDATGSPFSPSPPLVDTVLQPGEILNYSIRFHPQDTGMLARKLAVYHSDQTKMVPEKEIRGKGIGTVLDISHLELLFIPEILVRKVNVKNHSNTDVVIESGSITPEGSFKILTNFPIFLGIGDSIDIEIEWNGIIGQEANFNIKASPCVTDKSIRLGFYSALSQVFIPTVEADAKGRAVIPVNFSNAESKPYNGVRLFEAKILINPRLFLPEIVSSQYGKGSIISNDIVGDKRIIGFRIDGDFPKNGIVAEIHGIAGLAETDTSSILIDSSSVFWGQSVVVNFNSGFYRIKGVCEDRLLYRINKSLNILNIIPNPANESVELMFDTKSSMNIDLEIYNSLGLLVYKQNKISAKTGENKIKLNLSNLLTGNYRLTLRNESNFSVMNLVIVR